MYVLALTTVRQSSKTINRALDLADEHSQDLFVLFVVDEDVVREAVQDVSQNSFLDAASGQAVASVLANEYIERGDQMLKSIEVLARERGVKTRVQLKTGSFFQELKRIVDSESVEKIILTQRERSQFSRAVFGSPLEEFKSSTNIEVEVVVD